MLAVAAVAAVQAGGPAEARVAWVGDHVEVSNDPGGRIADRVAEIERLRASGVPVQLRGAFCMSTCTMFLALPTTCVEARTEFGFHGPSHYGLPLSSSDFEYWSQVIARHYPSALADWYLRRGRHVLNLTYVLTGAELSTYGVPICEPEGG